MKVIGGEQTGNVEDVVRAKLAMIVPILKALLHSLARDRIERLGGIERISLYDLAREFREGFGDAGICFEYAVHQAIASGNPIIHHLASEVLDEFCNIRNGAESILFGPEKEGVIPVLESVQQALTEDSVVYVGNRGRPPKLKRYIPKIISAYRRNEIRNTLPRCISGLWKADLFLGNRGPDAWVGTTIKINPSKLQGAEGLRIGIYPKRNAQDMPRRDPDLNLIRCPLPYDGEFMEFFYKAFFLVRAFLRHDAKVPPPEDLPDAEDRYLTKELQDRRDFPLLRVILTITSMAQPDLIRADDVHDQPVNKALSEIGGLQPMLPIFPVSEAVSVTPIPRQES